MRFLTKSRGYCVHFSRHNLPIYRVLPVGMAALSTSNPKLNQIEARSDSCCVPF